MADKPVLGYWNIRGLGHPIRFLLAYLEIDYEDKLYNTETQSEEWLADKATMKVDFPNLPYLLDGTKNVTESLAILKYLCRKYKPEMLGKTVKVQTDMDTVGNFVYDLFLVGLIPVIYEYTEELHNQFKQSEPVKLGYLNTFLNGKQWIAGNDLTYVDFFVYEVLRDLRVYDSKCLDNFANLQVYIERFENIPAIKKYMESPTFMKTPIFGAGSPIIKI